MLLISNHHHPLTFPAGPSLSSCCPPLAPLPHPYGSFAIRPRSRLESSDYPFGPRSLTVEPRLPASLPGLGHSAAAGFAGRHSAMRRSLAPYPHMLNRTLQIDRTAIVQGCICS